MEVTIENYTECCLRTWGGENQKERAELGIIGELGEVAEVLKKFLRGDFDEVERDKRLLKELGDLLYYIAIDMYLWDINFYDWFVCGYEHGEYSCTDLSNRINDYNQSNDHTGIIAMVFVSFIIDSGFTLQQVMQANIDKLTKRAENGLIQGDGSDR